MKMEREIHHIDEYFNEGLGNLEVNPPEEVWNNITKELDRKRRVRLFTIWTGLAAGLALFISLGIYVINYPKPQNIVASKTNLNTPKNSNIDKTDISNNKQSNKIDTPRKAQIGKPQGSHYQESAKNTAKQGLNANENANPDLKSDDHSTLKDNNSVLKDDNVVIKDNNIVKLDKDPLTDQKPEGMHITSTQDPFATNNSKKTNQENTTPANQFNSKQPEASKLANIDIIDPIVQQDKPKRKHWSFEGQVAPQYSFRNVSTTNGNAQKGSLYNSSEDGLMAYVGGVKVNYATSKRLTIQTGVFFSVMGQSYKVDDVSLPNSSGMTTYAYSQKSAYWLNNSIGPIVTHGSKQASPQSQTISSTDAVYSSIYINKASAGVLSAEQAVDGDNAKVIQQLKFIEIPVLARYLIIDGKIGCNLIGGVSTNILVNSDVILKQNGTRENIGETTNLQKLNYSSTVGIGIKYHWLKNVNLTLEPTYKYYLTSISLNDYKVHLYSFGIYTGLTFNF
jgi:hypothetical protein